MTSESIEQVGLTFAASEKINDALKKRGHGLGVRLLIVKSGCAGFSYGMEFVDQEGQGDKVLFFQKCTLFIAESIFQQIQGVVLDYRVNALEEGFTFLSQNHERYCRCGKSFACA